MRAWAAAKKRWRSTRRFPCRTRARAISRARSARRWQANDQNQAELWLRQALERFPRDPEILSLAARYEQARGDNERAAEYYRASLAVMPRNTPADHLAHLLDHPEQDTRRIGRSPRPICSGC